MMRANTIALVKAQETTGPQVHDSTLSENQATHKYQFPTDKASVPSKGTSCSLTGNVSFPP